MQSKKEVRKINSINLVSAFFSLLKKNLKLILRSKSSSVIIFLGPLIIIFLVGAAFNTSSLFNIKIGAYSNSYSELSENLLKELNDKQFQVIKIDTKDNCLLKLKENELHVCAIFPENLNVGETQNIEFYVDNSKINLVWIVIDTISKRVSTKSNELSQHLANNLLDILSKTEENLGQKKSVINNIGKSNKDLDEQFSKIASTLSLMDLKFTVSKLGVDKISSKLDTAIEETKTNKSSFESVYESISRSIKNSKDFEKKFNETSLIKEDLIVYLNQANKIIDESNKGVNEIESSINLINSDIQNVKTTSADIIASPIKVSINPISVKSTHLNFLFPTLVVLIIMFICLLLSSILVIREKLSNAYFRNFITPTSDILFILSDYVTNLIIVFIQLAIIFSVGIYYFKESLIEVLLRSFVLVVLLSTLFIFMGMLVGYLLKTEETAVLSTFSLGSLFLFFSGTILPLETLPDYLKKIADYNPFVLGEGILKKIMLFNFELNQLGFFFYVLLGYVFVLVISVYFARKLSKRAI